MQKQLEEEFLIQKYMKITKIDIWFIDKIANLVEMEQSLRACAPRVASGRGGIGKELLKEAKRLEFPDEVIARLTGLYRKTGA